MTQAENTRIEGKDGLKGTLIPGKSHNGEAEIELMTGQRLRVPAESLSLRADGSFFVPFSLTELLEQANRVLPVVQEELRIEKHVEETAKVAVHITPQSRQEVVDVPLTDEQVEVERVPLNRLIEAPIPIRQEGNVTIVPVFEEVLIVRKQLVLKEEVRITRHALTRRDQREVTLRSEEVHVLRSENPNTHPSSENSHQKS